MTPCAITFPRLDRQAVAAYRRLGRGLRLRFQVGDEAGELLLEPGRGPASGGVALSLESRCAVMTLSHADAILSLFGECPVTLADSGNDAGSWFWALFQQCMSPQLMSLFGYLQPLADVRHGPFECRISVVRGASRSVGRMLMSAEGLLALYDAGPWQPLKVPLPDPFPVSIPLVLGYVQLSLGQLRTVHAGDVLLPERLQFNGEGLGSLNVGRLRLDVRIDDEDRLRRLTVCSVEEVAMDDVLFASTDAGALDESLRMLEPDEPFEQLSVALSVRCGALNLSLGELRQLAPGVVLNVEGYGAGMAGLYYGDRPIGQGQLVEVDGCLGLQLSRITFSR